MEELLQNNFILAVCSILYGRPGYTTHFSVGCQLAFQAMSKGMRLVIEADLQSPVALLVDDPEQSKGTKPIPVPTRIASEMIGSGFMQNYLHDEKGRNWWCLTAASAQHFSF